MDIAQYISDLLENKNEVSIPGIGTFYKKVSGAIFNDTTNTFNPPTTALAFKTETGDEHILINNISKEKNISEPSARYFAEKFGDSIKAGLENDGKADLAPLGVLEKLAGENVFTPSNNFTSNENYGLIPVKELAFQTTADTFTSTPIVVNTLNDEDLNAPLTSEYVLPEEEVLVEEESKSAKWPYLLAGFLILITLGIITYIKYPETFDILIKPNNVDFNQKQVIPVGELKPIQPSKRSINPITDSVAIADSIMLEQMKQQGFDVEKAKDTLTTVKTEVETGSGKEETRFEVIGASWQTKIEAENYIKQMRAKGIDARIVENKRGRYIKVSLGSFTDRAKANQEMRRIHKEITEQAWILEIKNKAKP